MSHWSWDQRAGEDRADVIQPSHSQQLLKNVIEPVSKAPDKPSSKKKNFLLFSLLSDVNK